MTRHQRPERATLFDQTAEVYDRTRPRYPDALIDRVLGPDPEGLEVLDIATGTGIAAVQMAARGAHVLGIELNDRMARIARSHGIPTVTSMFEAWPPEGRRFDRVTCAQAWHWLDPEVATGKAVSLLHPGGELCLWWNVGSYPDALADALASCYREVLGPEYTLVRGYTANQRGSGPDFLTPLVEELATVPELAPARVARFPWAQTLTGSAWADELRSHSDHAALPEGERETLLAAVEEMIGNFGGSFEMRYAALLVAAARR